MMLISWRHRFIFVHVPKNGGTSLTRALVPFARWQDQLAYMPRLSSVTAKLAGPDHETRLTGLNPHARLATAIELLGADRLAPLTKIAFTRNPFSRVHSLYAHIKRVPSHPRHELLRDKSFADALPILCAEPWARQISFICNTATREIEMDFLGSVEAIETDIERLAEILALPKKLQLPRQNTNPRPVPAFASLYSDQTDHFVESFAEEFERFGYSTQPEEAHLPPLIRRQDDATK